MLSVKEDAKSGGLIEVYPKDFIPPHLASLCKREEKVERKA
jgi:hypothetical protein